MGGGGQTSTTGGQNDRVRLVSSYPSSSTVWTVVGIVDTSLSGGNRMTVTPYVVCTS